jgi:O-methyltransferase
MKPMESPYDRMDFLSHVHKNVDINLNLEILFDGATIGQTEFLPLYLDCIARSGTPVGSWKVFRRSQRALTLARYFYKSLSVEGARIECGVYQGFSSLLLAQISKINDEDFTGVGFHMADSFEGLSEPTQGDEIGYQQASSGEKFPLYSHQGGHFATQVEHVKKLMEGFPDANIHKGWIAAIFSELPETKWSFVHVDVDLYEPTKSCLEYFIPRMSKGGIIVNDDFESPLFPGGGSGWHEVLESQGLSYSVLDTGQAVFIK